MRLGVESDSLADLEVGCSVFSKSIQDAAGNPVGGIVHNVDITSDGTVEVSVIRFRHGDPYSHCFEGDDLDLGVTTFYASHARDCATGIHNWISRQRKLDGPERANWSRIAYLLDNAGGTGGLYLQHAGQRYIAQRAAKKAAS